MWLTSPQRFDKIQNVIGTYYFYNETVCRPNFILSILNTVQNQKKYINLLYVKNVLVNVKTKKKQKHKYRKVKWV